MDLCLSLRQPGERFSDLVSRAARLGSRRDIWRSVRAGIPLTAYKMATFWAIGTGTCGEPSPFRRMLAASWHSFFIVLSPAVFIAATMELALGKGAAVAATAGMMQVTIVALTVLWQAGTS
jgi:hypothetical protein